MDNILQVVALLRKHAELELHILQRQGTLWDCNSMPLK
jgi:hypothetical protein